MKHTWIVLSTLSLLFSGCLSEPDALSQADSSSPEAPAVLTPLRTLDDHAGHDHTSGQRLLLKDARWQDGDIPDSAGTHLTPETPVMQLGFLLDGPSTKGFQVRTRGLDGMWSAWADPEITWSEGEFHVGRLILTEPATELAFRGGEQLTYASAELYEQVVADVTRRTSELPFAPLPDAHQLRTQALAPASLVIPRAQWGARSPDKICGSVVAPYRLSIHHTASPDSDGGDPPARMRQMQAFHIDSRGWCDIGYHFVASQSGLLYQGRSDERRPGAHVGDQNAGNIGISFIGNYQGNNPPQIQLDAAAKLMAWVKSTYDIPWNRQSVRGHQEWPGQGTNCPGSNLLAKIPDLMAQATNGGSVTPPEIGVKVTWGEGTPNLHTQGTGAAIADIFPGDSFTAELRVTNHTAQPIRGVKLGYLIEKPYIQATNYVIETDHPAKDRATWVLNDADAEPGNPARDKLGKTGFLEMNAFGAGESKRVLITLEAKRYSLGAIDHPDVRLWVKHIDDIYGEQDSWDMPPALQETQDLLQAYAQIDVLARDEWQFDTGEEDNLEGWSACNASSNIDQLKINVNEGSLSAHVAGDDPCVRSPNWTRIDADTWDQLVLRERSHDGEHIKAIYWAREGEQFSEDRVVRVSAPGNGEFSPLIIPMGEHEAWSGEVVKLRVDVVDKKAPVASESNWYDVDAIFFQSSAQQSTSSEREAHLSGPVAKLITGTQAPGTDPEQPGVEPDEPTNNNQGGGVMEPGVDPDPLDAGDGDTQVAVNSGGCSSAQQPAPGGAGLLMLMIGGLLAWRRRLGAKGERQVP